MAQDKSDKAPAATPATRQANEWGLPDWTDAKDYTDWKRWDFMRWRWEFYRRRDDLRAAFDANAERTYREYCEAYPPWPDGSMGRVLRPDEPGFVAVLYYDAAIKFGYAGLPNPRISEQPARVIFSSLDYPGNTRMMKGKGPRYPGTAEHQCDVSDGEFAVVFDLDKPIGPQLAQLNGTLKGWQILRHGKALQKRHHDAKRLEYLRILDAREAMPDASWRVFTEALLSAGLVDRHKNPAGGYCDPPPQAGRDKWETAKALRFNF